MPLVLSDGLWHLYPPTRQKNNRTTNYCDHCHHNFFAMQVHLPRFASHRTASSSAEWSLDKLRSSFVEGHESTMWNIARLAPVGRHLFLQPPQWPRAVWKRLSEDHRCQGRSEPGCWIVSKTATEWEMITAADIQLSLHNDAASASATVYLQMPDQSFGISFRNVASDPT